MTKQGKKKRKKVKPMRSFIVAFMFTCLIIYLFITTLTACMKINETDDKISDAKAQYEEINSKNKETKRFLQNADENDIIERIARERLGYVLPNEKVFYDTN